MLPAIKSEKVRSCLQQKHIKMLEWPGNWFKPNGKLLA